MTVRRAVLDAGPDRLAPCGDRSRLAWDLRELCRYGIETVHVPGALGAAAAAARPALPRALRVTTAPVPPGDPDARVLFCEGAVPPGANLARLFAPGGPPRAIEAGGATASLRLARDLSPPRATVPPPASPAPDPSAFLRPALMLDRDGTLNVDRGYVGDRSRWEWMPGAIEAVRDATEAGWHVFVVTNQSGIGRGFYDEAAFRALQDWTADAVREAGGTIDDVRFCPHHPDAALPGYRRECAWRKPAPGMILDLIARWELDPARCAMVGDAARDLEAAAAAGIDGVRFAGGSLRDTVARVLARARYGREA